MSKNKKKTSSMRHNTISKNKKNTIPSMRHNTMSKNKKKKEYHL